LWCNPLELFFELIDRLEPLEINLEDLENSSLANMDTVLIENTLQVCCDEVPKKVEVPNEVESRLEVFLKIRNLFTFELTISLTAFVAKLINSR